MVEEFAVCTSFVSLKPDWEICMLFELCYCLEMSQCLKILFSHTCLLHNFSYSLVSVNKTYSFIFSSLWSKSDGQLSKYCVVCEISWCRCQQLTAVSIITALVTKILVIDKLLHPALKSAVSALWHDFHLCPSLQQILAMPVAMRHLKVVLMIDYLLVDCVSFCIFFS